MKRITFVILILLVISVLGKSQKHIKAKQITTKDGLSQNSVNQIFEDSEGYIWLATQDGLNRYNGYDFKIYRPDPQDSFSISDNFVYQIYEDTDNRLWLATRNGIDVFDKNTNRFYNIQSAEADVKQLYQLKYHNGQFLFISQGVKGSTLWSVSDQVSFTTAKNTIEAMGKIAHTSSIRLSNFLPDAQGDLWLFAVDTLYSTNTKKSPTGYKEGRFYFTVQGWDCISISESTIMMPEKKGVLVFDTKSGQTTRLFKEMEVYHYLKYNDQLWAGTDDGLYIIETNDTTKNKVIINQDPLDHTIVHHTLQDRYGQIWIGTANNGVYIYNPQKDQFQYQQTSLNEGQDLIWDISYHNGKTILASNYGLITDDGNKIILNNTKVTAGLVDTHGRVWAGKSDGEVVLFDQGIWKVQNKAVSLAVVDFVEAHEKIYIATQSGLYVYDDHNIEYSPFFKSSTYLMGLYLDKNQNLWITHGSGISYITRGLKKVVIPFVERDMKSINFNFSSGVAEDLHGNIWVATYGGGLSRLNSDSTFSHFTEKEGLSNNVVHGIIADDNGDLWLSSNGGISLFDPESENFVNYTINNGLLSHNFSINSFEKIDGGKIAVGTTDGVLEFAPDQVRPFSISPVLNWEDFQINYGPSPYQNKINKLERVTLSYQDRVFAISFIGLKFDNPDDVRYAHKLEGFHTEWVNMEKGNRKISYSSLPFGDYELKVKAISINNHFSPIERSLSIIVNPPFWLTWWFITIAVVLFLSLTFGVVYDLSRRKLKARLMELETREKVQEERERISRDLHDSVGTHLAYIVSRLDFLYLGWDKKAVSDKKNYLENITDFARSGMRMLRETIWALNEEHVSPASLKAKIDDYLKLCFANATTKYDFSFSITNGSVNAIVALNTFRIIQEAVSNGLKHAEARQINILVEISDDGFRLEITDDGIGFDIAEGEDKENHYGIRNMQKRAKEIDAELSISSTGKGTKLLVTSNNTP